VQNPDRLILICDCEGSMPLDPGAIARAGCGRVADAATQLCGRELGRFRAALAEGAPVTVACGFQRALFEEVATEDGFAAPLAFADIRETSGWSAQAASSGPKAAALIAAAAEEAAPVALVAMESRGVALILGRDGAAVEAAAALAATLDVTVLLRPGAAAEAPRRVTFPVLQGAIRAATGRLGAFELTVDAYAAPAPSSRGALRFGPARDGAVSRCDLVLDLGGGAPLFAGGELRPGYLRADPGDPAAVARAVRAAAELVGTFDKPRFIDFAADLCAHARNRKTGCTRCLDLCPASAIAPAGDSVAIDPFICAGCGMCAAACPTGAASYALPPVESVARRLRTLVRAWYAAGGQGAPVLLLHDDAHGGALIEASARHGNGLPAHVLPVAVNEITAVGPEIAAAALAWGAGAVRLLGRARPRHDPAGLRATLDLLDAVLPETGRAPGDVSLIETDDPDALEAALAGPVPPAPATRSAFLPPADKRGLLTAAFLEMNRAAPRPAARVALPAGAPFGAVALDTDACTLCMACVGVCPTGALVDNPETPMLRFTESACVQCGLCAATCPERAITLVPQIDFDAWDRPRRLLKEEPPFCCADCGKAFGVRSAIERVQARLADHWMFAGAEGAARLRVLSLCEDCRVAAVVTEGFDPHGPETRRVRTAEDYRDA
jgi:ferredoxin